MSDCFICAGTHDPEVHDASLRVRAWWREHLKLVIEPVDLSKKAQTFKVPAERYPSLVCKKRAKIAEA